MKYISFAMVLLIGLESSAEAANILADVTDTEGLPGFHTVVLMLETESDESFRGVDAKITGPLNQVKAAGVLDTPWTDLNAVLGDDAQRDSQFLFNSGDVLSIGVEENENILKGAISGLAQFDPPLPNPTPFVQLVIALPEDRSIPLGCDIHVNLAFDVGKPEPFTYEGTLNPLCIPEPTTLLLTHLSIVMAAASRRRVCR